MTYAIIGSGAIGGAIARQFGRKNIQVSIANRRGAASIAPLADQLGESVAAVDLAEGLDAEILFLAVPFTEAGTVAELKADWTGKTIIDATNAIDFTDFSPADLGGEHSSAIVARSFKGATVVKGFNTLPANVLAAEPETKDGNRTLFLAGDDDAANQQVATLAADLGYAPIILGPIAEGGRLQQFGGPLALHSFIKQN